QRDQAFAQRAAVFGWLVEPVGAQLGAAAVLVLQPGAAQQLAQAQISVAVAREQQDARRALAVGVVGHPAIGAADRLDALAPRRLVELDPAEQVAEVGDRDRRLRVGRRRLDQRVEAHDRVADRVFRMDAKMDEAGGGHRYNSIPMPRELSHRNAALLLAFCALCWSIAGVFTRHLERADGFEITFWRSFFCAVAMLVILARQRRGNPLTPVIAMGWPGLFSGLMWSVMFTCFMLAITRTSVANTLLVLSVSPLLAALLGRAVLGTRISPMTWAAIVLAGL